jgi:hypothetical protein
MVKEGSMKEDIANLYKAGGRTSVKEGFEFPGLVKNAMNLETRTEGAKGPAADVAFNIREPFMRQFIEDRSAPAAKFNAAIKGYMASEGDTQRIPREFANSVAGTGLKLRGVPGADAARMVIRRIARDVFEPVNLERGTLVEAHYANAAQAAGWKTISVDDAKALGLKVEAPFLERQPAEDAGVFTERTPGPPLSERDTMREAMSDIGQSTNPNIGPPSRITNLGFGEIPMAGDTGRVAMSDAGPTTNLSISGQPESGPVTIVDSGPLRLDLSAFVVVLKPKPINARQLADSEDFINGMVNSANALKQTATAEHLQPLLRGLLSSRDRFPSHPDYAPDSLRAKLEPDEFGNVKEVKGLSALYRLRSLEIQKLSDEAERLGIRPEALEDKVKLEKDMTQAIMDFHRAENPDKGIAALALAKRLPGGEQALYSVPLAEKAQAMRQKASLAHTVPLGPLGFKPFFRAAAIHAEPLTSAMPGKVPGVALAAGAEGSDIRQLLELAAELKREKEQQRNP